MISQLPRCEFVARGRVWRGSALLWTLDSTPAALAFRAPFGRRHPVTSPDLWGRRTFGWGCLVFLAAGEFDAAADLPDDGQPAETTLIIEGNHWHAVRVLAAEANEVGATIAGFGPPPYPVPYTL